MRKALGEEKAKAREAAVSTIRELRGNDIKNLKDNEVRELLAAVCQLLGLADQDGNIE